MEENLNNKDLSTKRVWHKTRAGIVFLSIVGVIVLSVTAFSGMVGYYAWQLRYGDSEELIKQFSGGSFSQDPGLATSGVGDLEKKDVAKYIRDFNPIQGGSDNPVTIVTFIDFECPYCQASYPIFVGAVNRYEPLVRVVFKNLPLENLHPGAMLSAQAAACAGEQGKFWDYYNILFADLDHSLENLNNLAINLGLDSQGFSSCVKSSKYTKNINQDMMDAVELGLVGTPTYFVNGYKIEGTLTADEWDKIILAVYNK